MKRLATAIALAAAAACSEPPPSDRICVPGHVDATEARIGPDAGGRILTLTVKEGDRIQQGQTILTLDTRDTQLAIDRAKAEQVAAEAQLRLVRAGSRIEDIRQAQSQVEAAWADGRLASSGRQSVESAKSVGYESAARAPASSSTRLNTNAPATNRPMMAMMADRLEPVTSTLIVNSAGPNTVANLSDTA